jgi:hypothetical protein
MWLGRRPGAHGLDVHLHHPALPPRVVARRLRNVARALWSRVLDRARSGARRCGRRLGLGEAGAVVERHRVVLPLRELRAIGRRAQRDATSIVGLRGAKGVRPPWPYGGSDPPATAPRGSAHGGGLTPLSASGGLTPDSRRRHAVPGRCPTEPRARTSSRVAQSDSSRGAWAVRDGVTGPHRRRRRPTMALRQQRTQRGCGWRAPTSAANAARVHHLRARRTRTANRRRAFSGRRWRARPPGVTPARWKGGEAPPE